MLERTFTIDINAPVQRVWDEITRRGIAHHAMFGTFLNGELRPGSPYSYRSRSGSHTFVLGQVLEVDPPRRLVHTFMFSMMEKDEPTLVVWELAPHEGGTRVTVTHSRFSGETATYRNVSTSWPKILALYKTIIETGAAPFSARFKNGLMMGLSFMLPKTARTEHAMRRVAAQPPNNPDPSSAPQAAQPLAAPPPG